jgi:hypothetical protein
MTSGQGSDASLSRDIRKMLNEGKFHKAQYSELDAIFSEEWKKHFSENWHHLNEGKIESMLKAKNLTDLLELFREVCRAMDERFNSTKPLGLKPG